LLQEELGRGNRWAEKLNREVEEIRARVAELQVEVERGNRWAEGLNREIAERCARIVELQDEVAREQESARGMAAGYEARVAALEDEARRLRTELLRIEALHAMVRDSRWLKLGRKAGLGPAI
jgi:predicted  nucleic acid-binding Zn-ribbon protein